MNPSGKKILKTALSYLQKHEGLPYNQALQKISRLIISGDAENNPLFGLLIAAELPSDPGQLHDLLKPGGIRE